MRWRAAAPRPTGSSSTTEHAPRLLWPIALGRHVAEQVAPSPGFTILTFGAAVLALLSFGLVMRAYAWTTWRSAWQPIWPGIDGWALAFPYVLLCSQPCSGGSCRVASWPSPFSPCRRSWSLRPATLARSGRT